MTGNDIPLGAGSLALLHIDTTSHAVWVLEGQCDHEAMVAAVVETLESEPVMRSVLVEVGGPLGRRAVAHPVPIDGGIVSHLDLRHVTEVGVDYENVFAEFFEQGRELDLFGRCETRVRVVSVTGDRTLLCIEVHHVCADARRLFEVARSILATYHRRVTGSAPDWARVAAIHSVGAAADAVAPASRRDLFEWARRLNRDYPPDRLTTVAGTASTAHGQIAARCFFGDDELRALRQRARAEGASFGDLVLASALVAIGEWNPARGADVDVTRTTFLVAQNRGSDNAAANDISGFTIGATGASLADPTGVLRSVARQRTDAAARGIDARLAVMNRKLQRIREIAPGRPVFERLAGSTSGGATLLFTNPGVLWPEIVDGRPTGDTVVRDVGGLQVTDLLLVPNAIRVPRLTVACVTFANRARVVVGGTRLTISQQELRDFAALVVRRACEDHL